MNQNDSRPSRVPRMLANLLVETAKGFEECDGDPNNPKWASSSLKINDTLCQWSLADLEFAKDGLTIMTLGIAMRIKILQDSN